MPRASGAVKAYGRWKMRWCGDGIICLVALPLMAIGLMQCLLAVSMIVTEASMQEQVESGEASKQSAKCSLLTRLNQQERTKSKQRHAATNTSTIQNRGIQWPKAGQVVLVGCIEAIDIFYAAVQWSDMTA
eukprot:scaffold37998_cov157-Skeletonema_marinoi.AAC.1